ncbi:MAG: gamma-glutamylcyclotransferase [Rhodospirillaceae bacterium]|nr:gamma-glutamylcyclotransferase [Rhodospirillaceae bacterium]|tara:strand:+ start:1284 stop:1985 length:702 start_codon:yes stop_codon:yes gene_type:complete
MTERFDISRETLLSGELSPHLQAAQDSGLIQLLTDEEREATRHALLERHTPSDDIFVFGFGSLMWNPACEVAGFHPALVRGWHRRFNLWTHLGRGTPELPGLTLGLEAGGSCRGMALCIEAGKVDSETEIIWRREMIAGAYIPIWVQADLGDRTVPAVSFAINPDYYRYGHRVPFNVQAHHIGCAEGPLGPCIEYLENTVTVLETMGLRRGPMHDLLKAAQKERRKHGAGATG